MPVTNPYYAIANEEGGFEISGVPPGKHRIMAWHPFAGKAEVEIEVKEGVKTQTSLEIKK